MFNKNLKIEIEKKNAILVVGSMYAIILYFRRRFFRVRL